MNAVSPEQAGFCIPPLQTCLGSCIQVCNLITLSGVTPALPHVPTALWGLEESPAAQVALSAP